MEEHPRKNRMASCLGILHRAQARKSQLLDELEKLNAEISNAANEYHRLDRERAEENITYCPPAGEPKKNRRKKKDKTSDDIGTLISAVSSLSQEEKDKLMAQLENKAKGGEV